MTKWDGLGLWVGLGLLWTGKASQERKRVYSEYNYIGGGGGISLLITQSLTSRKILARLQRRLVN